MAPRGRGGEMMSNWRRGEHVPVNQRALQPNKGTTDNQEYIATMVGSGLAILAVTATALAVKLLIPDPQPEVVIAPPIVVTHETVTTSAPSK